MKLKLILSIKCLLMLVIIIITLVKMTSSVSLENKIYLKVICIFTDYFYLFISEDS